MSTLGDGPITKRCRDCARDLPLAEFQIRNSRPDGRGPYCKTCYAARHRRYNAVRAARHGREQKPRRVIGEGRKWCPDCRSEKPLDEFPRSRAKSDGRGGYCKPCHNKRTRETAKRLYGGTRDYHLKRRYGLTSADVDAMIEAQGGTCATCPGNPEHVDHDHRTGNVRGVLCFNCNQALGNARDDITVLRSLIGYLSEHRLAVLRAETGITIDERSPAERIFLDYLETHRAG